MYVYFNKWIFVCMYVCMYVCTSFLVYVCIYVCMYVHSVFSLSEFAISTERPRAVTCRDRECTQHEQPRLLMPFKT